MTKLLGGDEEEPGVFGLKEATQHVNNKPKNIQAGVGGWGVGGSGGVMLMQRLY